MLFDQECCCRAYRIGLRGCSDSRRDVISLQCLGLLIQSSCRSDCWPEEICQRVTMSVRRGVLGSLSMLGQTLPTELIADAQAAGFDCLH
jgi:hypothetical protein